MPKFVGMLFFLCNVNPFRTPKSLPILTSSKIVKKRVSSSEGVNVLCQSHDFFRQVALSVCSNTSFLDELLREIIFGPSELRFLADHSRLSRRDDQKHL